MNVQSTQPPEADFQDRIAFENCPVCNSDRFDAERSADCSRHPCWVPPLSATLNWMRCEACGHSFAEGHFSGEAQKILTGQVQSDQRPGEAVEASRALSAGIVKQVLPYCREGVWLDLGIGNGSLMFTAEEFGFAVQGLDPRSEAVAAMRDLGYDVECGDFEECDSGKADVISMVEALPRHAFPRKVLTAAHKMLNPDGVLFLSMPNAEAFLWRNMTDQDVNPYWSEMQNLHNFGRTQICQLLGDTGFVLRNYGISQRYRCSMELVATKI